jgi:hypothetical protein
MASIKLHVYCYRIDQVISVYFPKPCLSVIVATSKRLVHEKDGELEIKRPVIKRGDRTELSARHNNFSTEDRHIFPKGFFLSEYQKADKVQKPQNT